jgi:hypothetical protein
MADATGLSKSAVQASVRTLTRRRLIRATRESRTAVPEYAVLRRGGDRRMRTVGLVSDLTRKLNPLA